MIKHGLIAQKVGMTRMVDEQGAMVPVTLLQVADQKITKILSQEHNGYNAIQVGYWPKPEFRLRKPDLARLRKAGVEDNFTRFKEFRLSEADAELAVGNSLGLELLDGVSSIDATGLTKGKGFQGAIKRWGSKSGRATHGSNYHNRPGSLGSNTTPGRVFKNKKVPGHTGAAQQTIQNLKVLTLDKEQNLIAVRGSVPGHRQAYLFIRPSRKIR